MKPEKWGSKKQRGNRGRREVRREQLCEVKVMLDPNYGRDLMLVPTAMLSPDIPAQRYWEVVNDRSLLDSITQLPDIQQPLPIQQVTSSGNLSLSWLMQQDMDNNAFNNLDLDQGNFGLIPAFDQIPWSLNDNSQQPEIQPTLAIDNTPFVFPPHYNQPSIFTENTPFPIQYELAPLPTENTQIVFPNYYEPIYPEMMNYLEPTPLRSLSQGYYNMESFPTFPPIQHGFAEYDAFVDGITTVTGEMATLDELLNDTKTEETGANY